MPSHIDGKPVIAWVICEKCNERHLVRPGIDKPWWWCGDEMMTLEEGQEIEVEYIEPNRNTELIIGG